MSDEKINISKTKKPRYKKTNVTVVDAKTGKKKDDGSTGVMDAENYINYINMKYPNYLTSQTPNAKRNRRQSAKALEIINSRKKPTGKKITPAKQKNINQASEVSKNIIKGYKKGSPVKFTSKPEKPLSPAAKKKQIKKQSKKYGGKIKNRNMGGVIGGGLASQDVTDYLYKYDS